MKRPLHALTCAGAVAHHAFELTAGVGLVFQPYLGLRGAGALWATTLPTWFVAAARGSPAWDRALAFLAGMSLGGSGLHFLLWPWSLRRGLPLLDQAEGLSPEQLPAYNAVLYSWAGVAALAVALETPRGVRRWALFGVLAASPLVASARHHFVWLREQARRNPAWWNRALAPANA